MIYFYMKNGGGIMPLIIELSLLTCVMASLTILQVPVDE